MFSDWVLPVALAGIALVLFYVLLILVRRANRKSTIAMLEKTIDAGVVQFGSLDNFLNSAPPEFEKWLSKNMSHLPVAIIYSRPLLRSTFRFIQNRLRSDVDS